MPCYCRSTEGQISPHKTDTVERSLRKCIFFLTHSSSRILKGRISSLQTSFNFSIVQLSVKANIFLGSESHNVHCAIGVAVSPTKIAAPLTQTTPPSPNHKPLEHHLFLFSSVLHRHTPSVHSGNESSQPLSLPYSLFTPLCSSAGLHPLLLAVSIPTQKCYAEEIWISYERIPQEHDDCRGPGDYDLCV